MTTKSRTFYPRRFYAFLSHLKWVFFLSATHFANRFQTAVSFFFFEALKDTHFGKTVNEAKEEKNYWQIWIIYETVQFRCVQIHAFGWFFLPLLLFLFKCCWIISLFAYLTATRTQQSISSSAMAAIPILVLFIQFISFQATRKQMTICKRSNKIENFMMK